MYWFAIAIIPPILWSISNHIDKYLYERYYRKSLPGSLMLLTAAISFFIALGVGLFRHSVFALPTRSILVLLVAGVLNFAYIFPYIYALLQDEASRVVPLFQMAPVFSYLLAWLFLHEHLTSVQLVAGVIITLAAIAINLDLDNRFRLKKTVFWLMMLAAVGFAAEGFLFKYGATNYGFWDGVFYQYSGMALAGLVVAIISKRFRDNFMMVFRANVHSILTISLLNEAITIAAFMTYNYATLLAPLALVTLASINTQPFFVILFGIILTVFFPALGKETITRRHLAQKIACVAIIFLGSYLLVTR